jgi:hypothetical protein
VTIFVLARDFPKICILRRFATSRRRQARHITIRPE